ncbi:MAG: SDR family oxidoreductase [candidate division KSB1 bacterium]|nr:SDR family oxidoreductase [candidate division KSB1 bacterium]
MDLGLEGKVALVAAASKGLGRAAAEALAREGCNVAICSRDAARVKEAADAIRSRTGRDVLPVVADLTRTEDVERFVQAAVSRFGRLHIVVSNAGGPPAGTFDDLTEEQWQQAIPQTLLSAVRLVRFSLPHLRASGWGRIIFLTSMTVKQPIDNLVTSNVLRPAVVGLAKSLALQLAPENITVNAIAQGYFLTERLQELAQENARRENVGAEAIYRRWEENIPAKRLGRPEELGDLVAFLASERAGYITGTTISIDGGFVRSLL